MTLHYRILGRVHNGTHLRPQPGTAPQKEQAYVGTVRGEGRCPNAPLWTRARSSTRVEFKLGLKVPILHGITFLYFAPCRFPWVLKLWPNHSHPIILTDKAPKIATFCTSCPHAINVPNFCTPSKSHIDDWTSAVASVNIMWWINLILSILFLLVREVVTQNSSR